MFDWTRQSGKTGALPGAGPVGPIGGAAVHSGQGLVSGTHVATELGWTRVDALRPGQAVRTIGQGMRQVAEIRQERLWVNATDVPAHMLPVIVPAGALGNRHGLCLLPDHGVVLDRRVVAGRLAVHPVETLIGLRGIHRAPQTHDIAIFTLVFETPEILLVEGGATGAGAQAQSGRTGRQTASWPGRPYPPRPGTDTKPAHREVVARLRRATRNAPAAAA